MALRIFSVTGEALNFGLRRMETIMRVAWLPVVMLLVLNMATVFAYLSVIAGRVITFADVPTFTRAEQLLVRLAAKGFEKSPDAMWAITGGNLALQALLIASFMAPLIRYSGLGEKPAPGVVRLAFGPDQIRYIASGIFSFLLVAVLILGPIAAASFYVLKYIVAAMSQTMASFPDPNSLHTIELTTAGESLAARGLTWVYDLAVPMAAVAPFAIALWLIFFFHFHPRNRPAAPEQGNAILRAMVTFGATAVLLAGGYWLLRQEVVTLIQSASAFGGDAVENLTRAPDNAVLLIGVVAYLFASYANLRLYPYPGVAVCRKSMLPGGTLKVSRGWNIIRLQFILLFVGAFLIIVQYLINNQAMGWMLQALSALYQAVSTYTRLIGSGVTADWVQPMFVWIWNGVKILVNIFWTFFSYGVVAGLYGRLYRESEQDETIDAIESSGGEIWRRK